MTSPESKMSAEAELVLKVTHRLLEKKGEHPESVEVKEELARMFLESQRIIEHLRRQGETRP